MEAKEQPAEISKQAEAPVPQVTTTSGGGNTALKVGLGICLGCLIIMIILVVGGVFAGGLAIKNIGLPFLKQAAEEVKKEELTKSLQETQQAVEKISEESKGTIKEGTSLPQNFPSDFPLYPGAKVENSLTGQQLGKEGFMVTLTSSDDWQKVSSFYKTNLPKKGWQVTASYESGDGGVITFSKGVTKGAVTIAEKEGKTTIGIALGESQ